MTRCSNDTLLRRRTPSRAPPHRQWSTVPAGLSTAGGRTPALRARMQTSGTGQRADRSRSRYHHHHPTTVGPRLLYIEYCDNLYRSTGLGVRGFWMDVLSRSPSRTISTASFPPLPCLKIGIPVVIPSDSTQWTREAARPGPPAAAGPWTADGRGAARRPRAASRRPPRWRGCVLWAPSASRQATFYLRRSSVPATPLGP